MQTKAQLVRQASRGQLDQPDKAVVRGDPAVVGPILGELGLIR